MADRTERRLRDMLDAIEQIEGMLAEKTLEDLNGDRYLRAAYERFLEILSEASRHVPPDLKDAFPDIPWRRIADIGNHLRHAYQQIDTEVLWNIHPGGELDLLRSAVEQFLRSDR
jgi:uncharacterized protein with HEPN domain